MSHSLQYENDRTEKATELFRLQLERNGTMDALTGWIKKIVEVPADKRPHDVLGHLKKNWNSWNGNIRSVAMRNALSDIQEELAGVLKENKELKREIAHLEETLLSEKVAALNASTKEKKSAQQSINSVVHEEHTKKEIPAVFTTKNTLFTLPCYAAFDPTLRASSFPHGGVYDSGVTVVPVFHNINQGVLF